MNQIPNGFVEVAPGVYSKPTTPDITLIMPPSHQREKVLQAEIREYCRERGWPFCWSRMDMPTSCGVGTPDFVIATPNGKTLWVECKVRCGKLRPEQCAWMAALRHLGHEAHVVTSLGEFIGIVEARRQ